MKKLLSIFFLAVFSLSSMAADCSIPYKQAEIKQKNINKILLFFGLGAVAATAAAEDSKVGAGGFMLLASGAKVASNNNDKTSATKNKYGRLLGAFSAAKSGAQDDHLDKIIRKAIKKSGKEPTNELVSKAKRLMVEGFEKEIFCPMEYSNSGCEEGKKVFKKKQIINHLATNL